MANTFLIIDDDINMRKMLEVLIRKNNLGKIVAQLDSGEYAVEEILFYNPDIVLIDLLLPIKDGVEIINMVRKEGYEGKFIMISQVEDEEMVSKAYESGVIFFITKPLNMIEAVNVIKGVCRNIELEKSFALIKNAVFNVDSQSKDSKSSKLSLDEQITAIFADIGIVGGTGGDALRKVIHKIINFKKHNSSSIYQLQEIYDEIAKEENQNGYKKVNRRAIEQRVRRTIQKSLQTIAEIGCDDYYNGKFTEYSTLLFDFSQVKQEMRFVDGDTNERGKINIKKFIEGIISKLDI